MLTAITLFLLSASNELVGVTVLQKSCLECFQNALNSSDPWVSALVLKHSGYMTIWMEFGDFTSPDNWSKLLLLP